MFRTSWRRLLASLFRPTARTICNRPAPSRRRRLHLEGLESRLAPATFTDNGTTLNLLLNTANVNAALVSNGTSYTVTLTGDTWSGTNDANVTGNGTATLTVTSAGIAAFTNKISLTDSASGASATFNDSGAHAYANNFMLALDMGSAGITFNGASRFGKNSLNAQTDTNISINSGALVSTSDGGISMQANQQATPTAGNFIGMNIEGTVTSSGSGDIVLKGRGGNDVATVGHVGVFLLGGTVSSTGTGHITVAGTGGTGSVADFGVELSGGGTLITSITGAMEITGRAGDTTGDDANGVVSFSGKITSTGTATITINATGGTGTSNTDGFRTDGAGSEVDTVDGNISITGTPGGAAGANAILLNGGGLNSTGAGNITLTGDSMNLSAGTIGAGTNIVTLQPKTSGTAINLGTATAGALSLTNADLGVITAGTLHIGNAASADITTSNAIALTNVTTLALETGGGISNTSGGTLAVKSGTGNLRLSAANAISLTGTNSVNKLSAAVTNAGQGFSFNNQGALDIATVDGVSGIATSGGAITAATTDGNLTVDQNVAAGAAPVSLTAGCTVAHPDNILTNNAAITAASANLTADRMTLDPGTINVGTGQANILNLQPCTAGRTIDLGGTGDPTGTLQLSPAELNTITAGIVRIGNSTAGNLSVTAAIAPTGFSTLSLHSGGAISQTSGSTVTVTNLATQGTGGVTLRETNQVSQIAGTASNQTFTFVNGGGLLTVGTVDGVTDINAGGSGDVNLTVGTNAATGVLVSQFPNDGVADVTGHTVTLTALGPTIGATGQIGFFTGSAQFFEVAATTLNASTNNSRLWLSAIGGAAVGSISAGTDAAILKTVNGDLTSTHTGGNVTTPDVTGGAVILLSPGTSGSFGSGSNPLQVQTSTLRASVSGAGSTGSINVRNVAAGGDLAVPSATTVNGGINLTVAGGNLTTTAATGTDINAPGNTVTLAASGNVVSGTAAAATDVDADSLAVSGSGVGASANPLKTALNTIAASAGMGGVFLSNAGALSVGSVASLSGITTAKSNVSLTTGDKLTLAQSINAGTSADASIVTLDPALNGVSQTGGTVTGGNLLLLGNGGFSITQSGNAVGTLAANVSGAVAYTNSPALLVGTVSGTAGINTNGNNVTLTSGLLTIGDGGGQKITAAGATADLNAAGIQENAGSTLTAINARLQGTGTFQLGQANAVVTLAAAVSGALSYTNKQALVVGTVNSTAGINTSGNNVTLTTTAGLLTLGDGGGQGITAAGAIADLNAFGVNENGGSGIVAGMTRLQGTGTFQLNQAANDAGTLAANIAGALNYQDANTLTVGSVTANGSTTNGITTNKNNITLTTGDELKLAQAVNAGTSGDATIVMLDPAKNGVQETSGAITGGNLLLLGAGAFTLNQPSNSVATLAGSINGAPGTIGGALSYINNQALLVGTVNGMAGVNTGGQDVTLITTSGQLTLGDGGGQGIVAAGATAALNTSGVMEKTNSTITAGSALFQGIGTYGLGQANAIGTLAAGVTGQFTLMDNQALTVATVQGMFGVATGNNPLTLMTTGNFTAIDGGSASVINTQSQTATIDAGMGMTMPGSVLTVDVAGQITATGGATISGKAGAAVTENFRLRPGSGSSTTINAFGNCTGTMRLENIQEALGDPRKATIALVIDPGNMCNGTFTFNKDAQRQIIYKGFKLQGPGQGLSLQATSVQSRNIPTNSFDITLQLFLQDLVTGSTSQQGASFQINAAANFPPVNLNQFLLSPVFASPSAPFSAPRIAVGDVQGLGGSTDIVIANGPGGPPLVTVVNGLNFALLAASDPNHNVQEDILARFYAFDPTFQGGVNVAVGGLQAGTGKGSIVVSEDFGGVSTVNIFDHLPDKASVKNPPLLRPDRTITPYAAGFHGGVRLAVGDVAGTIALPKPITPEPIIVVAPGPGAALPVLVFDAITLKILMEITPYGFGYADGIFVAAGDYLGNGKSNDIVTAPQSGVPIINVYDGTKPSNQTPILQVAAFQPDQTVNDPLVMKPTPVTVVSSVNEQPATGFLFHFADPDPKHPFLVATSLTGVSSIALGNVNSATGTRDLIVGRGIGKTAIVSTVSVNARSVAGGTLSAPKLPMAKRSMWYRLRTPRGINVAR